MKKVYVNEKWCLGCHLCEYYCAFAGTAEKEHYKRLFYSDNKLNGYILIGNVEKAGIYTSLIRERTPLDTIDFALVCEKPELMVFTKQDRMVKLGEAK